MTYRENITAILECYFTGFKKEIIDSACNRILEQEPKTGHWITTRTFMHNGEYYCDKCKCDSPNNEKWDYCPNCGCRMIEPQK